MQRFVKLLRSYFPILEWSPKYTRQTAVNDLVVALIVSIMLIPQSLAYAQLAGLPPEVGLYASMAPLIMYAIFGTSRSLSVGPVAVTSLMTLAAVAPIATQGTPEYLAAAMALALLTGLILIVLGFLKLGFLIKFYELSGHGRIGHCRGHPDCRRSADTGSGDPFKRRNISCSNHFVGRKLQSDQYLYSRHRCACIYLFAGGTEIPC